MQATHFIHRGTRGNQQGFTLIELMITLVVVAVTLALAVPTYEDITQRRQTTAQAEELAAFLSYAQGEAIKSNQLISVELDHDADDDWCIGASEGAGGCECEEVDETDAEFCAVNGVPQIFANGGQPKARMVSHSADTVFVYDPVRGIKNTGDLANHAYTLQSENGNWSLQVNVGPTGRIRVCNPNASKKVPGFDLCAVVSVPPIVITTTPPPSTTTPAES